ncbi:MAG: hypothetical protein SGJ20_05780 [Planctomycetota bacterium]|nr:hypothetical protein [Planctomycetota bacterium]
MQPKHWLVDVLTSAWVCFGLVGSAFGIFAGVYDGDNFLKSDDPYIAGFAIGVVAAGMAALYVLVHRLAKESWQAKLIYLVGLAVWCGGLWYWSTIPGEGSGIVELASVVSAISGVAVWGILAVGFGRKTFWIASLLVVIGGLLYLNWLVPRMVAMGG